MCVFICLTAAVSAQQFIYSEIPKTGKSINDFLPSEWKIIDSSTTDINGDKRRDISMHIGYTKTLKSKVNGEEVNWNPQMILIFFKDSTDNKYTLALEDNKFIPDKGSGEGRDPDTPPDAEVSVSKKGVVAIILDYLHGTNTYKFRYQNGGFYLIGATTVGSEGADSYESWDFNFLTRKVEHTKNNKKELKPFNFDKLKIMRELKPVGTWEIIPNVFI